MRHGSAGIARNSAHPSARVERLRSHEQTERLLVGATAIAFALPLLFSPLPPGSDTPWHAAVIAIVGADDPERFLGFFEVDSGLDALSTYAVVYELLALVAGLVGPAGAVSVLFIAYIVAFVLAARSLLRAFGGDGSAALLAAPVAYSSTLEFGFMAYLPTLPLTLWLWALIRRAMRGGTTPARMVGIAAAWIAICLCHPFAAAIAGLGALLLIAVDAGARPRRGLAIAGLLAAGSLPAALALVALGDVAGGSSLPVEGMSLWDRINFQVFSDPLDSIASAPPHLVGFAGGAWPYAICAAALAVAIAWRIASPPERPASGDRASHRSGLYLALLLVSLYLVTPFTIQWPRNLTAAQARILPLLWVALLVALRPAPGLHPAPGWRHWRFAAAAVAAGALLVLQLRSLLPLAAEARDLQSVIDRSAPGARSLGLIEQPRTVDRAPPHSMRNATGWVIARRGGFASHLLIAERSPLNRGHHIPVHLATDAPTPPAPQLGFPRSFRWDRHATGWDQFLIRDLDPSAPHDYFAGHEADVELIARAGRWRIVGRRRVPAP